MIPGTNLLGKLTRLRIEAYTDNEFTNRSGYFEVDLNPKSLSKFYRVNFLPRKRRDMPVHELKFSGMDPQVLRFNFLVDGSGALGNNTIGPFRGKIDVQKRINDFMNTVYKYEGQQHSSKWLILTWGPHIFKCQVKDVNVEYTMFRPDGSPLRAMIKAAFQENISNQRRAAEIKLRSPDLTHQRVINEGDNLVNMTQRIYETIVPVVTVARSNDLDSLRNLRVGEKLFFPPLKIDQK